MVFNKHVLPVWAFLSLCPCLLPLVPCGQALGADFSGQKEEEGGQASPLPATPQALAPAPALEQAAQRNDDSFGDPRCPAVAVVGAAGPVAPAPRSGGLGQQVKGYLLEFGLAPAQIQGLWDTFNRLLDEKGQVQPFCLARFDPYFVSFGLWRAHQEYLAQELAQDAAAKKLLPFKTLLTCLLAKSLYIKGSSSTPFRSSDFQSLASLVRSNPYLTSLDLFRCGIPDTWLGVLGTAFHLKDLSLEENAVTDTGLPCLLALSQLVTLNLAKNHITAHGAALLAASASLKALNLYKNPVGDKGAAALSQNTLLTCLDLRETGISDPGAKALAGNKTLTALRLRSNKITDKGAEAFLNNRHITHLELTGNPVSPDLLAFLDDLMHSHGYLAQLEETSMPLLVRPFLPPHKERVRVLSIDGGGIRGLLPARILQEIGDALARKTGAPFHFAEHVDLMAGTSTGGLISLGLAVPGEKGRPRYTPATLVSLYSDKGPEIFPAPWRHLKVLAQAKYDPKPLEAFLEGYFGDLPLSSCLSRLLVTAFDLAASQAHTFDSLEARQDTNRDFLVKCVARATSAAPTYFPSARVANIQGQPFEFVDGGIYANNPALLALKRAKELYPDAREYQVFSFGTGEGDAKSLSGLGGQGLAGREMNLARVLMNSAAAYTDSLIAKECEADPRITYIRIQPPLSETEKAMDNTQAQNIQGLLATAQATIEANRPPIEAIIQEFYKDYGNS